MQGEGSSNEALPLAGVKVLDLSQIGAGPYSTSMLGDLGADVVKVEPVAGDSFRYVDNAYGYGESAYFFGVNRSKRSLALDIRDPQGLDVLQRLVRQADVFVVAFRPDAVRRLRVDYETLREINPRLIYTSITAFGESGPRANEPGMDILAQAISGMMGVTGEVDGGPIKVGVPIADFLTSVFVGFGICAALRLRDQTGRGEKLSVNLLDGQIAMFANYITAYDKSGVPFRPQGGGHAQLVPYQPFLGSDDQYFILACLNDKFWANLREFLVRYDERFADPRFASNAGRVQHRHDLCSWLQELFEKEPAARWLDELAAVNVPCGPIHRMEDALSEPQALHNESVVELEHPQFGRYKVPNNPIHFAESPTGPRGYSPGLGEHSRDILLAAGFKPEELEHLIELGIVGLARSSKTDS